MNIDCKYYNKQFESTVKFKVGPNRPMVIVLECEESILIKGEIDAPTTLSVSCCYIAPSFLVS